MYVYNKNHLSAGTWSICSRMHWLEIAVHKYSIYARLQANNRTMGQKSTCKLDCGGALSPFDIETISDWMIMYVLNDLVTMARTIPTSQTIGRKKECIENWMEYNTNSNTYHTLVVFVVSINVFFFVVCSLLLLLCLLLRFCYVYTLYSSISHNVDLACSTAISYVGCWTIINVALICLLWVQ